MDNHLAFNVPGRPVPQGSVRAFARGGKAMVVQGGSKESRERLATWRSDVRAVAQEAMKNSPPFRGAISMQVVFSFRRPNAHYGTGRNAERIKDSAPIDHLRQPDLDKLNRALLDALTGIVYVDDSQVITLDSRKRWITLADSEGTIVSLREVSS